MIGNIYKNIKQKGQGIVEYALILALVVGIGMMLNGSNLGGAVKDTFDKVANALGETKDYALGEIKNLAWAVKNLSGLSRDEIKNQATQEERIKMDQEALANIGKLFLNKTEEELQAIIKDNGLIKTDNSKVNNNIFLVSYHDNPNADANGYYTDFSYKGTNLEDGYVDILTAMQGGNPDGTATYSDVIKSENRYFYSNNMLDDKTGDQYVNDRSIRVNLHYGTNDDNKVVVDAVRVKVNRGSSTAGEPATNYYRELDVKVGLGKDSKQTIAGDPGAISKKTSEDTVKDSWYDLNNWQTVFNKQ